jgi:hypothetical protein
MGLQQERALVERGHEVAADPSAMRERRHGERERTARAPAGAAQACVEHGRVDAPSARRMIGTSGASPSRGRNTSAASTGTASSASASDASTVAITADASGRYMRPSIPSIANSGANTATTIAVANAIGGPTSTAAASALMDSLAVGSLRELAASCDDVLGDDDRRVDEQADRDREAPSVIVLSRSPRARAGRPQRDRERKSKRDQQRRAQVAEQCEQHATTRPRREHRAADAAERRADELRLVVDDAQLDAAREARADLAERRADRRRRPHRVGAELLDHAAAHHLAAQPMRDAARARRASRTSATSPSRTGVPARIATTVARRSSTSRRDRRRAPSTRSALHDEAAGGSAFAPSTACSTSSSVTRARHASGSICTWNWRR